MNNLVFTICSNNYLAQAITLGISLLKHNPDYSFKIGLVDRKNESIDYSQIKFEVIEVEKIGIAAFDEMFKRYSITELNTAVKPFYFEYFFRENEKMDAAIYLDPDILVYNNFEVLEQALISNNIVLTPHFTTPIEDDKFQQEEDFLNAGIYNLGFIAIRNSTEGKRMVSWWANRLQNKAYIDFKRGLFTDQIWINLAPLYFENVHILLHAGYNVAYWNLHERELKNGQVKFNHNWFPLIFFHFSGFNPLTPDILSRYQNRFDFENRKDIVSTFNGYADHLIKNKFEGFAKIGCYFAIEKDKIDLANYLAYKQSIPLLKRMVRGFILRYIRLFRVNISYYTQ